MNSCYSKIVTKLSENMGWIRDPAKSYTGSGSLGQKGTGSRIRIRNTVYILLFDLKTRMNQNSSSSVILTIVLFRYFAYRTVLLALFQLLWVITGTTGK